MQSQVVKHKNLSAFIHRHSVSSLPAYNRGMSFAAGDQVGPYRIEGVLGSGGMGKVYRAHDSRLGRAVAIKLLAETPEPTSEAMRRFQTEARAVAALNHANLLVLHDLGLHAGQPYLVCELLEGETLREVLARHPLPPRKVIEYGACIASGLAAAHEQGIIHRDLKPENLFLTRGGQIKILDFGLAKLRRVSSGIGSDAETLSAATLPGTVLGTVGYMAPEQVRGQEGDARADIFSLGAVLYEMLSGRRAFGGEHAADVLGGILRDEPEELEKLCPAAPPALARIVHRCLEKQPERRFQSASDLAFALQALSGSGSGSSLRAAPPVSARRPRLLWILAGATAIVALVALAGLALRRHSSPVPLPYFQPLSYQRGTVGEARFTPSGHSLVYSAAWQGSPMQLYYQRQNSHNSRPLHLNGSIAAISSHGELAVLLACRPWGENSCAGTLATTSLSGGAPRSLLRQVVFADWNPNGQLAVIHRQQGWLQVEYPLGHVLYRTHEWITNLRFSPDGRQLAFQQSFPGSDVGSLCLLPAAGGPVKLLARGWNSQEGLAWSPGGRSIWVAGARLNGAADAIYRVALNGRRRLILRLPPTLRLLDISAHGQLLISADEWRVQLRGFFAGNRQPHDLSWNDWSVLAGLTSSGHHVLFCECNDGPTGHTFYRGTAGSPAANLGAGVAMALSPNGKWALAANIKLNPPRLQLWPTGVGQPRRLRTDSLVNFYTHSAGWLPDGRDIVYAAKQARQPWRLYRQAISGGGLAQPISGPIQPTFGDGFVSTDGRWALAKQVNRVWAAFPVRGGVARPIPALPSAVIPAGWASQPGQLFYTHRTMPLIIYRLNLRTGNSHLVQTASLPAKSGIRSIREVMITPDGRYYAYSYLQISSHLLRIEGLSAAR